ncbi:hypothetical protein K8354_07915 [Polaribacter litorisediminis]|uniref:hypothetical protein n=1 Tax=Polaribacter litorisediminis TaxID=1908341 RepID=UPI001CC13DBA|nr:hypothetical protein [Polaribacter litorisediminis]UAM99720.1 hypothetical protein K8354_07915 [Polaribacter litorisediminis]
MGKKKIRATILDISAYERYEIIKAVMSRYNTAIEHSFFLEATALIESLISDRLESRIGELTKQPVSFNTIGNLLDTLRTIETDTLLKQIMNKQINNWCGDRNKVIHQAAKIEIGKKKDYNSFLKLAKKTAKDGRKIFNEYDKQLRKLRSTSLKKRVEK